MMSETVVEIRKDLVNSEKYVHYLDSSSILEIKFSKVETYVFSAIFYTTRKNKYLLSLY